MQVDPKTVGEWSGMRDISGTEIYDGDIVRDRNDVIYEVKRLCASFELFPKRKNAVHGYRPTILDNSLGLTIIGNIYDNASLIAAEHPTKDQWIKQMIERPLSGYEPFCMFDGAYCNDAYSKKCYECDVASEHYQKTEKIWEEKE